MPKVFFKTRYFWLLWVLTTRELKRKYKSASLGFLWIMINPLIQMAVLAIVFTLFIKIEVKDYWLFALSGLLSWIFFSTSLQAGTSSLIENRDLIKKVPFPRELLPISSVFAHLITSSLAVVMLVGVVFFFSGTNISFLLLIPLILLEGALVTGLALLFSSFDIFYRDVSFIVSALLTAWFYLTPVIYPLSLIPEKLLKLYSLNPMVGITASFQSIFVDEAFFSPESLRITIIETLIILFLGYLVFRKRGKYFADWV